jgi:excisionase family DNA binding protein
MCQSASSPLGTECFRWSGVTFGVTPIGRMDCDHGKPPGTNQDRSLPMSKNPTSKSPKKPLLSVEEAAILLGETRSTLYRAIKTGDFPLPIFRIGRRIRIPRRSIERLLAGLPLMQPDDLQVVLPRPSIRPKNQSDLAGALGLATPEDSIFPT